MGRHRPPGKRRPRDNKHPSVNETTVPAADQDAVGDLGRARPALLKFMFDADSSWEIRWQKIDLSDGFWRMIVESGQEYNFVFQMPERPGDAEIFYVIPSSLQMGWKNSPAYFCTGTEATRRLLERIMALTIHSGIPAPHRHEDHCVDPTSPSAPDPAAWTPPSDFLFLSRVFVDDFMNGLAGPIDRPGQQEEQRWASRAALHAIHAIFPPPDVLKHVGGKDSISVKKLLALDAQYKQTETLLGFDMCGAPGRGRTTWLPPGKRLKYTERIDAALAQPRNYIGMLGFQEIHGKLQFASVVMPCMRGLMTPLNRALSSPPGKPPPTCVGLAKDSELRETLVDMRRLLDLGTAWPSHITEIVPPSLPHYYGYVDFAACGLGGVWLPCTRWLQPIVWRLQTPPDIAALARTPGSSISNSDGEAAAVFVGELLLSHVLGDNIAGISTHLGSDNSATVGWNQRMASRAMHRAPDRFLRWQALRARYTRRGPADVDHVAGITNEFGDFPSRSYEQSWPNDSDDSAFFTEFSRRYPLPNTLSQHGSWRLVQPTSEIASAAFSILRNQYASARPQTTSTGDVGVALPPMLASTLSYRTCSSPTSTWNEATCSWPLLSPSGTVSTTKASELRQRRSRRPYENAPSAWASGDFATLADEIRPSPV